MKKNIETEKKNMLLKHSRYINCQYLLNFLCFKSMFLSFVHLYFYSVILALTLQLPICYYILYKFNFNVTRFKNRSQG